MTNKTLIKRVFEFSKPFRKTIAVLFACIMATTLIEAGNTYLLSAIFDIIQKHSSNPAYMKPALILASLAGIGVILKILVSRFQGNMEIKKIDILVQNHLNHHSISKYFGLSLIHI